MKNVYNFAASNKEKSSNVDKCGHFDLAGTP